MLLLSGYRPPASWRVAALLGLLEPALAYLGDTVGLSHTAAVDGSIISGLESGLAFWQGALKRTAPVFRVIREAAAVDAHAAAPENERAAQRLRNYQTAARLLRDRGALRDNLTLDQAAAAILAIGHPETYRTLVLEGSWNERQWATGRAPLSKRHCWRPDRKRAAT